MRRMRSITPSPAALTGLTFNTTIGSYGQYGWNCQVTPYVSPSTCWPAISRQKNIYVVDHGDGINAAGVQALYPADIAVSTIAAVLFVNYAAGNFRLQAGSPGHLAASDGADIGCDIDALEAALL